MKLSQQSQSLLHNVLQTLCDTYPATAADPALTDIHFQPSQETGDLLVFDDDDNVLARTNIVEWTAATDHFHQHVTNDLRAAIDAFTPPEALRELGLWKPYSLVLVDDDRETICDLLLVDDDTLLANDPLLQDLDDDLNAFLSHLLDED